jgi:hypothetical protein
MAVYQGFVGFCRAIRLDPELVLRAWWPPLVDEIEELRPLLEGAIPANAELVVQVERLFQSSWPGRSSGAA